ncbi:hypothetical protein D3C72_535110 [compost metagenome]
MARVLDQSQLERGVDAALFQARGLILDSMKLDDHSSSATSTALAFMALEEVGKGVIIRNMMVESNPDWERFWQLLNDHRAKIDHALTFQHTLRTLTLPQDIAPLFKSPLKVGLLDYCALNLPEPKYLTNFREEALYVFFDPHNAAFSKPSPFPRETLVKIRKAVESLAYNVDTVLLGDLMKGTKEINQKLIDRIERLVVSQLILEDKLESKEIFETGKNVKLSLMEFLPGGDKA